MRATKYFRKSEEMANFAKEWCDTSPYRWSLRTTLRCDHVHHERRKSMILIEEETILQKLTTCRTCNLRGNSLELEQELYNLKKEQNGGKDQ